MKFIILLTCGIFLCGPQKVFAGKEGGGGFVIVTDNTVRLEDTLRKAQEYGNQLDLNSATNKALKERIQYYLDLLTKRRLDVRALSQEIFDVDVEYQLRE